LDLWVVIRHGICGGAFMFCTCEAFYAAGGFDERLFWAEDAAMSWALKRQGPLRRSISPLKQVVEPVQVMYWPEAD
jgi:hypothetical protein